jgi:hypothetical protein
MKGKRERETKTETSTSHLREGHCISRPGDLSPIAPIAPTRRAGMRSDALWVGHVLEHNSPLRGWYASHVARPLSVGSRQGETTQFYHSTAVYMTSKGLIHGSQQSSIPRHGAGRARSEMNQGRQTNFISDSHLHAECIGELFFDLPRLTCFSTL